MLIKLLVFNLLCTLHECLLCSCPFNNTLINRNLKCKTQVRWSRHTGSESPSVPTSQQRIKEKEELLEKLRRLIEVEFYPPSFEVDVTKLD